MHATPFPIGLSKLQRSITYSTDITVGKNAQEVRNANWQDSLYEYNAASGVKTTADVETLEAFFHVCRGRESAFLLKDLGDYTIPQSGSTPQSIGTATASQTAFQIYKRYTDVLGNTHDRTITRPSPTTSDLAVYDNGVLKTYSTDYTYSTTTGIITFTSGRTAGHVISITLALYYVPVRFMSDRLPIDLIMMYVSSGNQVRLAELADCGMIEIRE